jgi:hypothetical protein
MKRVIFILLLLSPILAFAQSGVRYFGYFYNDANSSFDENYGHINLYHLSQMVIANGTADRDATTQHILGELAKAKARGVRAMVTAAPFVLHWTDSTQTWSAEPNAATAWKALTDQLVASGYIIPGRPDLSTVAAIYLLDEPNKAGFVDVGSSANPTLASAVNVVRTNAATGGIPIAAIFNINFSDSPQGLKLFDWVGFDDYTLSQQDWLATYNNTFKGMTTAAQRTIYAPKAAVGSALGTSNYYDPTAVNNAFNSDAKAIWLVPFTWFDTSEWTGTRDIPALRTAYTQIGGSIRSASCSSTLGEQSYCLGTAKKAAMIAASYLLQ